MVKRGEDMAFSDRMKDLLDQGLSASRDFAVKAGAKAQDLSERGLLMVEIKQLENQAQKALTRLGHETYREFSDGGRTSVDRDDPVIKSIIDEITLVRDTLDKKEKELKNR